MIEQRERENPHRPTVSYQGGWGWWAQGINPINDRLVCRIRKTPDEAYRIAERWANNGYTEPEVSE